MILIIITVLCHLTLLDCPKDTFQSFRVTQFLDFCLSLQLYLFQISLCFLFFFFLTMYFFSQPYICTTCFSRLKKRFYSTAHLSIETLCLLNSPILIIAVKGKLITITNHICFAKLPLNRKKYAQNQQNLDTFQFLSIINRAAMNNIEQVSLQ